MFVFVLNSLQKQRDETYNSESFMGDCFLPTVGIDRIYLNHGTRDIMPLHRHDAVNRVDVSIVTSQYPQVVTRRVWWIKVIYKKENINVDNI